MKKQILSLCMTVGCVQLAFTQFIAPFTVDNLNIQSYQNSKAIVVIFTSSQCKFATQYVERLNGLYSQYQAQNIAFLAINSNDAALCPSEDASNMRTVSNYSFPYLKDNDQRVARTFGAERTPEIFVLKPTTGQFEIVYRGAVDDNPLDVNMVRNHTLRNALDQLIVGQKPVNANIGMGCPIKWKK